MAAGRGSNFQAIIDAKSKGEIPDVEISQLVVNNPEAYAVEIAKKNDIPYEIIDSTTMTREEFDNLCDKFRPEHLWEKKSNRWELKITPREYFEKNKK